MFHLRLRENDTPNSWASSLHRGTQRSISVSERNYTPISWAHPTHGLSLRPTHSVCVLEDVSRNCNHQHSLSAREAFSIRPSLTEVLELRLGCSHQHSLSTREVFSTRPSLSRKYSNFILEIIINTPSQLGRYSPPGQVSHGSTQTSSWQAVW
jgi:hypothetical protein